MIIVGLITMITITTVVMNPVLHHHLLAVMITVMITITSIMTTALTKVISNLNPEFEWNSHSYVVCENLLIRFGKGNLPCLQCKVKALAMPAF